MTEREKAESIPDRQEILATLVGILDELTQDWDTELSGEVGPETRLIEDLAFESIDVVQLIVMIEERYRRSDLPFEELMMVDGRYVEEIKVGDIVEFLQRELGNSSKVVH